MEDISLQHTGSVVLLIASLVIGTALSFWIYRRTIPQTTASKRQLLASLRAIGLGLVIFTIFRPVLSLTKTTEDEPRVAFALDRSRSMQLPVSRTDSSSRSRAMLSILDTDLRSFFTDNTKPLTIGFDERTDVLVSPVTTISDTGSLTNISALFTRLKEKQKDEYIGAIVLLSDGAYTAGSNPLYAAKELGIPVFAVGLGDSTGDADASITDILCPDKGTVGMPMPIDINARITGITSPARLKIVIAADGENVDEQIIIADPNNERYNISTVYRPVKEGTVKLTAKIESLENERNEKNNIAVKFIRIQKNSLRVVLFAGAPSSDVSFIRTFFSNRADIELQTYIGKQGSEFYEGKIAQEKINNPDLVILIGYPISETTPEQMNVLRKLLISDSRSLLFIPSRNVDYRKLMQLDEALPFSIRPERISANEIKVSASVTAGKENNPIVRIQSTSEKWDALAPLIKTETMFSPKPESEVLADASIQGVNIGQPLIISRRIGRSRQLALTGYGLWQWKLTSFGREKAFRALSRQTDTTITESALDLFLSNATRWLAIRDDEKRVRITPTRKLYDAGEPVDFSAYVVDASDIGIENAVVTARIISPSMQPIEITLEDKGGGRYQTRQSLRLPAGDYTYTGNAMKADQSLGSDDGRFNIGEYSIEFAEVRMRADVLRSLAEGTGGKFYTKETAASLANDIRKHPRFISKQTRVKHEYEARNSWPLLLLAIICFASEWFIRKRSGML